jgi:hypothetical protein
MELIPLLDQREIAILADAVEAMKRAHLRHYEEAGPEAVHSRLRALYEAMRECVRTRHLAPIEAHAEAVARDRHHMGFGIGEVQTAFNVLEEAVWHRVVVEVEPARLAESLALVGTALGAGKDRLAQVWVSLATRTQAPALDVAALFRGTEGV